MTALPSVFITHAAPTLPQDACPARAFLGDLGRELPRPKAVLCVSAHWEAAAPRISGAARPETIHDFFGFPPALYELRYPAPGDPALAQRIAALLQQSGFEAAVDPDHGLDHGAWVPLSLMWPAADIPVLQLSVQTALGPEHHLALGAALRPLRKEGVLILASGSATHNLREWHGTRLDDPPPAYVSAFAGWLDDAVVRGDRDTLVNYRDEAPEARRNHPSDEHFLPLFVALAAGSEGTGRKLHDSYTYGVFYMGAYAFD